MQGWGAPVAPRRPTTLLGGNQCRRLNAAAAVVYRGHRGFAVLGISGGGPQGLAGAQAFASRLLGDGCVSGVALLWDPATSDGMLRKFAPRSSRTRAAAPPRRRPARTARSSQRSEPFRSATSGCRSTSGKGCRPQTAGAHAELLAVRVHGAVLLQYADEGHFLVPRRLGEILTTISRIADRSIATG